MAKKQTRRTLSFERQLHSAAVARAATLGKATSAYVSELIRADLAQAGLQPPDAAKHLRVRLAPPPDIIQPPADEAVQAAIEFTREQMIIARFTSKLRGDGKTRCRWCGDIFNRLLPHTTFAGVKFHPGCLALMLSLNR